MINKAYIYPYNIKRTSSSQYEIIPEQKADYIYDFDQFTLFNSMMNFGYIQFSEGKLIISDKQIVEFFNYAKDNILRNIDIAQYYKLLDISSPYTRQIPTITENERFISNSHKMTVAWENDTTTGKMKCSPKAFKRDGLEIFNFEGELLGSIYPEYFRLYEIIDNANSNWKIWTNTERYAFLDELVNLSSKRPFIISDELLQAHEHIY